MNKNADFPATAHSPAATSPNRDNNSSRPEATTTARRSSNARDATDEKATSATDTSGSAVRRSRSLPACARSTASLRAERTTGTAPAGRITSPGAPSDRSSAGASSTMMCAFVPLTPNDDTPARRGRPSTCHSRASVSSRT